MRFAIRFRTYACSALGIVTLTLCANAFAQSTVAPATESTAPALSSDQITAWIADLDSSRYLVRERATQQLLAAIEAGSAEPLDALLIAANGGHPEQEDRAVWILRNLIGIENLDLRQQVLERLTQVQDRPQVLAEAKQAIAEMRHDLAIRAIEELGGRYVEAGADAYLGQSPYPQILIPDGWRGGDEGLKHLLDVRGVPFVTIVGTNITADGLAQLADAESLQGLRLYGTHLKESDVAKLRTQLEGVEFDYRRGGFLGVIGRTDQNAAIVQTVQPNSAAAAADIRPNDRILKFNGTPVANFAALTAEIAKHIPGDEVTLELDRGAGPFEVKLELGQWRSP
jgi:hypothetical protein